MKEKICPFCGASIPKDVRVCPVCGRALPDSKRLVKCRVCGAKVDGELEICPVCGSKLKDNSLWWLTKLGYAAIVVVLGALVLLYGRGVLNAASSLRGKARSVLSRGIIYIPTPSGFVASAQLTPTTTKKIGAPTSPAVRTSTPRPTPTQTASLLPPTPTFSPTPTATPTLAPTATPSPTPTSTPTPAPTATPKPKPTSTPKRKKKPTPTPTPVPTPTTVAYKYGAPTPFEPENGAKFSGQSTTITLRWKFDRRLASDERFQIPVTFTKSGQKQTWKLESGENYLVVPRELYGQADDPQSLYTWSVLVVRVKGDKRIPISPASKAWTFHWYK